MKSLICSSHFQNFGLEIDKLLSQFALSYLKLPAISLTFIAKKLPSWEFDLLVNALLVLLQLKIGCNGATPSSFNAVKLEFSADDGVTWDLVVPPCHGNTADPAGCSFERHQASIYYPGSYDDWRRVVVTLKGKNHICGLDCKRLFEWSYVCFCSFLEWNYTDHLRLINLKS